MDDSRPLTSLSRRRLMQVGGGSLLGSAGLISCTQHPLPPPIALPDFSVLGVLNFAVDQIEIENLHDDRANYPHIEALSPHTPAQIIKHWIDQVMQPSGGFTDNSLLTITIMDASLTEEKLPRAPGLSGLFSVEQTEAYHGHILLEINASFSDFQGEMRIESQASQSVDENTSLRARQQVWVDLGEKMVRDIDRTLRENLKAELPRLLLTQ